MSAQALKGWVALLAALSLATSNAQNRTDCTVVSVHDGDTLTARCAGAQLKVRLVEIDAPERLQPYSRRATDSLKSLCLGKAAELHDPHLDRYGRTLARVYCAGTDVSAAQVNRGLAWAFTKYQTDPAIPALEADARAAKRGLWRAQAPVPPWEYRHSHH